MLDFRRKSKDGSIYQDIENCDYQKTFKGMDVHNTQQIQNESQYKRASVMPRKVFAFIVSVLVFFTTIVLDSSFKLLFWIAKQKDMALFKKTTLSNWLYGGFTLFGTFHAIMLFMFALMFALCAYMLLMKVLMKNLKAQNLIYDQGHIDMYDDDSRLQVPEEMMRSYDVFPDTGFSTSVSPSTLLSHIPCSNKGLNKVPIVKRYEEDTEVDGVMCYKGEPMVDDEGYYIYEDAPVFDNTFQENLFDVAQIPHDSKYRKFWDIAKVPYNPKVNGKRLDRDKLSYDTIGNVIKNDWVWEDFEVQRPAGVFLVDTSPSNTMVLAITRGGKGQTYIEPMIDMWMREKRKNNVVINDPKGELLRMKYVPASIRGYDIVQFNLINPVNTDIANILGYASESAREGDFVKCPAYIEAMADVFFPKEGSADPFWQDAASNAFKRSCYGLIDLFREEEMELRRKAIRMRMSKVALEQKIDELWGKVTLYNAYQFFVMLSSKKSQNPDQILLDPEKLKEWEKAKKQAEMESVMNGKIIVPQMKGIEPKDYLSLFFEATMQLPKNQLRTFCSNVDNTLKTIGGSDKTIASVYGIALVSMAFFTDPTISSLTSGRPSQNFDMKGMSFPRRFGIRFSSEYREKYKVRGLLAKWSAYDDPNFENNLGKDFYHEEIISREGWAKYLFDGKFENRINYVKCDLVDTKSNLIVKSFYFKYTMGYMKSLDGFIYKKEPISNEKIRRDGILEEMQYDKTKKKFILRDTFITVKKMQNFYKDDSTITDVKVPAIEQYLCKYNEKPKMVFFITPPHLASYAKLILIIIKQMVDCNFESSYMGKPTQKPLYKTRYMLDELGNLQSGGQGIPNLNTMLSIGLGQEQQFTLILQTLQQLRDVYGDSSDRIIQGNVGNIIFLKSTDDAMIDSLVKLSGITHNIRIETETVSINEAKMVNANDSVISVQKTLKEEPVLKFNDFLYISKSPNSSIVFRAGDFPIWNRNNLALPMSWRLFQNQPEVLNRKFSLQTIPTLSTASEFDVRKNQPNFYKLLEKRVKQARLVPELIEKYQEMHEYSDYQMEMLDPDVFADEIMDAVNQCLEAGGWDNEDENSDWTISAEENEYLEQFAKEIPDWEEMIGSNEKQYGNGTLSLNDIYPQKVMDAVIAQKVIAEAYKNSLGGFRHDDNFVVKGENLYSVQGEPYVVQSKFLQKEDLSNVSDEHAHKKEAIENFEKESENEFVVHEAFIKYLISLDDWKEIAKGQFDKEVEKAFNKL